MSQDGDNRSRRNVLRTTAAGIGLATIPGAAFGKSTESSDPKGEDIGAGLYLYQKSSRETEDNFIETVVLTDESVQPTEKTTYNIRSNKESGSVSISEISQDGISTQSHNNIIQGSGSMVSPIGECGAFDYTHELRGDWIKLHNTAGSIGKSTLALAIAHIASGGWLVAGEIAVAIISASSPENEYFFGYRDFDAHQLGHTITMNQPVISTERFPSLHTTLDITGSNLTHPTLGK